MTRPLRHHLMRRGRQIVNRHTRGNARRNVESARRLLALVLIRRLDKAVVLRLVVLRRCIAWSNDCRKHDFVNAVGRNKQLGVTQLDLNLFLRHQVRQTHREDVGSLLFEQRCALPCFFGFLKVLLRLIALFDLRDDDLVADLHAHRVDGSAGRCRKNVSSINRT